MTSIPLRSFQTFFSHIKNNGNCWEWQGTLHNGYGRSYLKRKKILAHVFSYELFVGEIPKGLTLDHLCRNRKCVNPEHLEPVTNKENILRGNGICGVNSRKPHCKRGHEFTKENIYRIKNNHRDCKICMKMRNDARPKKNGRVQNLF